MATLITQLEQYQPWDATESAHQAAILELLRSNSAAFDRHAYQPGHITGSTWILAEETEQVALIFHRRINRWLQPGGHAEPGENNGVSTALREAAEELGLMIDPARASLFDLDVHRIPATATQPEHSHFDLRYLCRIEHQPLDSGSDAAAARWFTVAELEAIALDQSMKRMLDKGLKAIGS
jgi:8-oxo-dGTP pyrophosphatase MutT (NUDIX family)